MECIVLHLFIPLCWWCAKLWSSDWLSSSPFSPWRVHEVSDVVALSFWVTLSPPPAKSHHYSKTWIVNMTNVFPQTQRAVPTVCFGCCKSNKLIWHMVSRRPQFEGNMGKLLKEQKGSVGERVWLPLFLLAACFFFLLLVHSRLVQTQSS